MVDREITAYPGETITIYVSAGQVPEPPDENGSGDDTVTEPAGDPEPAGAVVQDPDPQSVGVTGEDETPQDEPAQG